MFCPVDFFIGTLLHSKSVKLCIFSKIFVGQRAGALLAVALATLRKLKLKSYNIL